MSNTALILADYLPPAAEVAKTSLAARADHIRDYLKNADETWELHIGYVCLLGRELLIAKEQTGHGQFLSWIGKSFPEQKERSLRRYMQFLADVAQRSPLVANLIQRPMLNAGAGAGPDLSLLKQLCHAVAEVLDGKSISAYLRDTGRCRPLIAQGERAPGVKQTPAEAAAARQQAAETFADLLVAHDLTFCADNKSTHLLHADLSNARIKEILDAGLTRNRVCKDILKSRKTKTNQQKTAKTAKKGAKK